MDEELQNDYINSGSSGDEPMDYSELIEKEALTGEYPFDVIQESIETQFNNYINIEDKTNYVEIFYEELNNSYMALERDEEEFHKAELKEILDKIYDRFEAFIARLFNQRLSLTIMALENEEADEDEVKFVVKTLYEYFILNARGNFKNAISKDIKRKIHTLIMDDREYFATIRNMLNEYSPLLIAMSPAEFIAYNSNKDIDELFNTGKVSGNFLRRYTPKLYDNEDLEVEIINQITLSQSLRRDLEYGRTE